MINLLILHLTFLHARITKKPFALGKPMSISIEPTTACNLGCPECPSGLQQFTRPTGNLKPDKFRSWLDQISDHCFYINFYFQGEPFIHQHIFDMIAYASQKKMYTSTSTNGHFLSPTNAERIVNSGLDRLIISIDGTTQEVYEQYRVHGKLDLVLEGTKNMIAAKRKLNSQTPHVIFQFLVVKPNEHQINDVYALAKTLGVDEVRLKTAQIYHPTPDHPLIPKQSRYSRYKSTREGKMVLKNEMLNNCFRMWTSSVITWDGKIVPCCFDKDAKHQLGDLQEKTFEEIWRSSKYKSFRTNVFTHRESIDICANCSEGTKVWA
ncbi:MAG: radical SAM/SPASM domain-containing protein [Flavobacteriales bacterium]|jgi:radical SAM protein with 4Fe4S-binding SPASM domain